MEVKKNKKNKRIFARLFVRPLTAPAPRPTDPGVSPAANAYSYNASGRIAQLPQLIRACPAPAPKKRTFVRGDPDTNICLIEPLFAFEPKKRDPDRISFLIFIF